LCYPHVNNIDWLIAYTIFVVLSTCEHTCTESQTLKLSSRYQLLYYHTASSTA